MNAPLYTTEILRLAASLPEPVALDRVDGFAEERSPTCGSTVRVEVQIDEEGRVAGVSQKVQACAFGQASAALLAANATGRTRDQVVQAANELSDWLGGTRVDPGQWAGLAALAPARTRRSRHAAILLPFRGLARAMKTVAG